ncbi:hypothetical protein EE612_033900 [Oryza sativa]|nr:hypothetical protein EE612_033900 [Oryza sativa]
MLVSPSSVRALAFLHRRFPPPPPPPRPPPPPAPTTLLPRALPWPSPRSRRPKRLRRRPSRPSPAPARSPRRSGGGGAPPRRSRPRWPPSSASFSRWRPRLARRCASAASAPRLRVISKTWRTRSTGLSTRRSPTRTRSCSTSPRGRLLAAC